jgi:uncharacterized membrane protein YqgA involved in biofilm formation
MTGTLINTVAVVVGAGVGMGFGAALPERVKRTVIGALGLVTIFVGIKNALLTENELVLLLSLVLGGIAGELLRIDRQLDVLADRVRRLAGGGEDGQFVTGFVTATLVFCVGPLTILGTLLEGAGDSSGTKLLLIKSVLDLFAAAAFASTFGVGVLASAAAVLLIQGGLTAVGYFVGHALPPALTNEAVAAGGLILVALSLLLLELKKPEDWRVANLLPALVFAPPLAWLAARVMPAL